MLNELQKQMSVQVRGVSKTFGKNSNRVFALKEVDFDAKSSEIIMIVGPSGCGKTTLLSVIAGTLNADTGEIHVFGTPLHRLTDFEITLFRRRNIGFIFQNYHLIRSISILENVSIPLMLNGENRTVARKKAGLALEAVGLGGRENELPRNLSGGQQQRVAIARALIHEPRLIICDEPTAALDAENGIKIMDLMKEVVKSPDRAVIIVTHDSRIFCYADRVAKMDDGRIESLGVSA